MVSKEYRFRFYLNARHTVNSNNENNQIHPHTWEIVFTIRKSEGDYFNYRKIEKEIRKQIAEYEGKYLNEIPPFDGIVPIMENIADLINSKLIDKLFVFGGNLVKTEISENPKRTYILRNTFIETILPEEKVAEKMMPEAEPIQTPEAGFVSEESKKIIPDPITEMEIKPDAESIEAIKRVINTSGLIAATASNIGEPDSLISAAEGFATVARKLLNVETTRYEKYNKPEEFNKPEKEININESEIFKSLSYDELVSDSDLKPFEEARFEASLQEGLDVDLGETPMATFEAVPEALSKEDSETFLESSSKEETDYTSAGSNTYKAERITAMDSVSYTQRFREMMNQLDEELAKEAEILANNKNFNTSQSDFEAVKKPEAVGKQDTVDSSETYDEREFATNSNLHSYPETVAEIEKHEKKDEIKSKKEMSNSIYIILSMLFVILLSIPLVLWITRSGTYPWGTEIWPGLAKVNQIFNEFIGVNITPLYFVVFIFIFGAFGWILWGAKTGRRVLALSLAVIWFVLPDNLRVLFSEGDLARIFVTALIPFILLALMNYFEKKNIKSFIILTLLIAFAAINQAILAIMIAIAIIIYAVVYGIVNGKLKKSLFAILSVVLGLLLASFWIITSYNSGALWQDQSAFADLVKNLTFFATDSLNPLLRLNNPEIYYFGLPIILISVFGLFYGDKKSKTAFSIVLAIFFAAVTIFLPFMIKISVNQLYWMLRVTPIALGMFFMGLLLWKKMNKGITIAIVLILLIDCAVSFVGLV